jgi:hypothetical protein
MSAIRRAFVCVLLICLPVSAQLAKRTEGLKKNDGLIPFYWDERKGDLLFELSSALLSSKVLHFTSLATGVGSTNAQADRSSLGGSAVIHFERNGARVFVVQENSSFRADNASPELQRAVERGFPTSILAALPIEAEENGTLLVKANPLIVRDAFGVLAQLKNPTRFVGGFTVREPGTGPSWRFDEARSGVSMANTKAFPRNTEVESVLTFASDATSSQHNQPDPTALTLRQHQSFVALPEPGYQPLEFDPRVGYLTNTFDDLAQPYTDMPARALALRWRLQKKDPGAPMSEPVKPIIFYIDPAMPEPIRSAAIKGTLWWNQGFEQAGFKNAVRVEELPQGADPLDVRYPSIQWTNRNGRGWSVGMVSADPRTGEILHSIVQLDSHRMRTIGNYWKALMASTPTGAKTNPMAITEPGIEMFAELDVLTEEKLVVDRLALLTAHEIGHVLGIDHNFIGSTFDRGSVMDYFQPRVKIKADGSLDLSDAYQTTLGSYDRFAVEWGYSTGTDPKTEPARREKIVQNAYAKGIVFGHYSDPRWNSYDDGPDPVSHLRATIPIRNALVAKYGPQLLRNREPFSHLQSRFALVYLYHRYALAAAINTIGGAKIPPTLKGDPWKPIDLWPQAAQREALTVALSTLQPKNTDISRELWLLLAPTEDSSNDPERFRSAGGYLFAPADGARAIADIVYGGLLQPERLQRVRILSQDDPAALSPEVIIAESIKAAFADGSNVAAQQVLADKLMTLAADANATAEIQALAWSGLDQFDVASAAVGQQTPVMRMLRDQIKLFRLDPQRNLPKRLGARPPAGPPV